MGLFNLFSKKPNKPYKEEGLNKIYDLLFCDNIDLYKSETRGKEYPWSILLADDPDIDEVKKIAANTRLNSRPRILAFNLLLAKGIKTEIKELLGVIFEVAMPKGLDTLAAYSDGTARFISHGEAVIIWDAQREDANVLISNLMEESLQTVNKIGPSDAPRRPFPTGGMVRLTFLVSNGLYFGEGPFEILHKDPKGGPIIDAATKLMAFLIEQKR